MFTMFFFVLPIAQTWCDIFWRLCLWKPYRCPGSIRLALPLRERRWKSWSWPRSNSAQTGGCSASLWWSLRAILLLCRCRHSDTEGRTAFRLGRMWLSTTMTSNSTSPLKAGDRKGWKQKGSPFVRVSRLNRALWGGQNACQGGLRHFDIFT